MNRIRENYSLNSKTRFQVHAYPSIKRHVPQKNAFMQSCMKGKFLTNKSIMQSGRKVIPTDLLHTKQRLMQKQPSSQNIISTSPTHSLTRGGKRPKSNIAPLPSTSMNRQELPPSGASQTSVLPAQKTKSTRDENGSVYSKSLKDRIRHFGNPLRGPVVTEMFVHYFYFLIVLLVAYSTGWDQDIRAYMALVYMNLSLYTLEISRLVYAKRTNSVIPVYLSLPVFALLIVLSRSVHQIVMVLWYISFLLLCMQSGSSQLQLHFKIYTVVFMSLYLIVVCIITISGSRNNEAFLLQRLPGRSLWRRT